MQLTQEQKNIQSGFSGSRRNLMIKALAGTGKTSTIKLLGASLTLSQRERAKFIAFGAGIVEELNSVLPEGLKAATVHSLGKGILKRHLKEQILGDWEVDDSKYRLLCDYWMEANELGPNCDYFNRPDEESTVTYGDVRDSIKDLIHFVMVTVSKPTTKNLETLAGHYSIEVPNWDIAVRAVPEVLKFGQTGVVVSGYEGLRYGMLEMISYDEMLYLPLVLPGVRPYFFDILFVDEAQDLCRAARILVQRMLGRYGRAVFVGDENQAIMGFAGADCDSMANIITEFLCLVFPLTCCWRCPTSNVAFANQIVPALRAAPNALLGELLSIPEDKVADVVQAGDLIISRTCAPIVARCWELIQRGIPAIVRGRDIGAGLKRILRDLAKVAGFAYAAPEGEQGPDFRDFLARYQNAKVFNLSKKPGNEMAVQSIVDRCETLRMLYEKLWGVGRRSLDDLITEIDSLFDDEITNKVVLCTVHRSKGLQAKHVFIERFDLMPHPMAASDWAILQEENLKYVALTRAMFALYIVRDKPGGAIYPYPFGAVQPAAAVQERALPALPALFEVETEVEADTALVVAADVSTDGRSPHEIAGDYLKVLNECRARGDAAGADAAARMASMWFAREARDQFRAKKARCFLLAARLASDAHLPAESVELAREGLLTADADCAAELKALIAELTQELSGDCLLVMAAPDPAPSPRLPALQRPSGRAVSAVPRSYPQVAACLRTSAPAATLTMEFLVPDMEATHLYLISDDEAA
jgi:DNA helicase-2/ATP-dependent DNA helicase PcrA